MIETVVERPGLLRDRVYVNVQQYGNTSAAFIPIALDEVARSGCLAPSPVVALVGFGAGLTWGTCLITYRPAMGEMINWPVVINNIHRTRDNQHRG